MQTTLTTAIAETLTPNEIAELCTFAERLPDKNIQRTLLSLVQPLRTQRPPPQQQLAFGF
jgi:hypothetical protein